MTSGLCCVLANGQSSCEGSQAPHGSDRRFLFPFLRVWVIGGVGSLSTGSPSGRGSGYLGLMYSQAPVRSYTKDRAGTTPRKGEDIRSRTEIPHVGTSAGHIGPRLWLAAACRSFVVERVPPQGRPKREPKGTKRYASRPTRVEKLLTEPSMLRPCSGM